MTLTDRDRKIVIALIPILILLAYWFLMLAPKRADSTKLGDELARQEVKRDKAQQQVAALKAAQNSFAEDYATVVKLGKAIPTNVDMPSLIVQLNAAAEGTDISFERIKVGERQSASAGTTGTTATTPGGSSSTSSGGSSSSTPASAAGGAPAQTGPGQAAEKANNAKSTADSASSQSGGSSSSSSSSSGSSTSSSGSSTPTGASVPGLDTVPLEFTFKGGFFNLADFFHQLKRFVRVANERIAVRGRLMAINGFTFKASAFPRLEAQVFATVYLTPKEQGATAGATPGGPSAPGASGSTPAASGSGGSAPPAPSAPPAAVSAR